MGMDIDKLLKLVRSGDLEPDEAKVQLEELLQAKSQGGKQDAAGIRMPESGTAPAKGVVPPSGQGVADLGYAQVDIDRQRRTGFPEVIYGEGKTGEQLAAIFLKLTQHGDRVLATRVSKEKAEVTLAAVPDAQYNGTARTLAWYKDPKGAASLGGGYTAVVCAGTSDLPVAEEAAVTAEMLGSRVERVYDVGVAGIHRLLARIDLIRGADAIIVVAGMEGALPSVVGGLVNKPMIAVPTSIGYGASFGGLSALLGMLNSCAPGITVVNIDNGFGAGYSAGLIVTTMARRIGEA